VDGSAFTNFYEFSAALPDISAPPSQPAFTNADGIGPNELVLLNGTLYGTASGGGNYGHGTVFRVSTDGSGFATLHDFVGDAAVFDGAQPNSLTLVNGRLFGTTVFGYDGTVFTINPDGAQYTNLFTFTGGGDGAWPNGLALVDKVLYGTAGGGGSGSNQGGTVFSINLDGSGFTPLYSFTNATGSSPRAGLIASGDTLYGTTRSGGNIGDNDSGWGTIFAIKTNGTGYVILHAFSVPGVIGLDQNMFPRGTNTDGAWPTAALALNGSTLYGTTYTGGSAGNGTIFAINTDGTGFTNLYSFSALNLNTNLDGANPQWVGLTVSGITLYGTIRAGGPWGNGTVFSISFPPQLRIASSGTNIIVSWPVALAGFDYSRFRLQYTTNLASPVWSAISQEPVLVDGLNTVRNPIGAYQQFFRLMR
jgi:uncharacterized repeat protein (TIGR03803 family)